jgi:hypothetical protein
VAGGLSKINSHQSNQAVPSSRGYVSRVYAFFTEVLLLDLELEYLTFHVHAPIEGQFATWEDIIALLLRRQGLATPQRSLAL